MVTSARFLYWPRASFVWLLAPFLLHHLLLLLLAHCFPPLALAPHLGSNPSRPWGRLVPIAPEDSVKVVKNRRLTMLIRSFTPKITTFVAGAAWNGDRGDPRSEERRAGELRVQLEGRRDGRKGQGVRREGRKNGRDGLGELEFAGGEETPEEGAKCRAGVDDKEIWGRSDGCAATVGLHSLAVRAKLVRIAADRRAHRTRTVPAHACAAHDRPPRSQRNLHASHPPRR